MRIAFLAHNLVGQGKRIADYYKFDESRIEILPNAISEFIKKP